MPLERELQGRRLTAITRVMLFLMDLGIAAQVDPTTLPTADQAARAARHDIGQLFQRMNLDRTFEQTPWSGWLVLFASIIVALAAGRVINWLFTRAGERFSTRDWQLYSATARALAHPLRLASFALGISVGLTPIALSAHVREFATDVIKLLWITAIGWGLFNLVDVLDLLLERVIRHARGSAGALDGQVITLLRKSARVFLVIVFVLFTAENVFGADIGAWLAGLGIAGLAVSLAAQDSIKNLFGSITILLDRPFSVGDRIVFDGHDGPVEHIGFRSTKIRTLDGELVTVPNAKIVDVSVRNVEARASIRRVMNITITCDTPPEKVEQAVNIVREILSDPGIASAWKMEKLPPRVAFNELNADSLNIKVFYWFHPGSDYWAYFQHAERINLMLLRRFNEAGIEFAFPTQTLYLANNDKRQLSLRMLRDTDQSWPTPEPSPR